MNRIERISAILIQLQSKKVVKGQDIADRFSISLRTAYRDIKAIEESGVPIIGEAGVGYSLVDGYRLPPIMFTKEEAISLLTAEKLVEKLTDSSTYQVYQSAMFKIKAVLKKEDKEHVENMGNHIEVIKNPYLPESKISNNHIQVILDSIAKKNVVKIDYFANHNQKNTIRNVEPVGVFYMGSQWYLIGFCLLRNDYRNFRIDRITKSQQTDKPFQKNHPPLKTYLKEVTKEKPGLYSVVMRIDTDKLRYIGDQKYYNGFVSEKKLNKQTEMTFLTSSLEGFARWFLMFGDCAEIVSPSQLKLRVEEIVNKMRKKIK